jgi:hypothetical protein
MGRNGEAVQGIWEGMREAGQGIWEGMREAVQGIWEGMERLSYPECMGLPFLGLHVLSSLNICLPRIFLNTLRWIFTTMT